MPPRLTLHKVRLNFRESIKPTSFLNSLSFIES